MDPGQKRGWRRLYMRNALSTRDPNSLVSGGINTVGASPADNGIAEDADSSRITLLTVGSDLSRASAAAAWLFRVRDDYDAVVDTTAPVDLRVIVEVVSIGDAAKGVCVVAGFTNSQTFASQHLEGGVHDDATGRRLRAGGSGGVVDQTAAGSTLYYADHNMVCGNGFASHSVMHGRQSSGADVASNRKVGNSNVADMAGELFAYFTIGRSNVVGAVNSAVAVRIWLQQPIIHHQSYIPS